MIKFGLAGGVLGHSLSSVIHTNLFKIMSREGEYKHYETQNLDKTFEEALSLLDAFNITIPYKKDIMKHLTTVDKTAELYNACNFVIRRNNEYYGYNTDVDGFLYALMSKNVKLSGKKVLVTGAGGVSHMLAATSAIEGAEVTILARNEEKASSLCDFVYEKTGKKLKLFNGSLDFDILLQGTPAGMYPNYFDSPFPLINLKNIPFVFDTIYNPVKNLTVSVSEYFGNTAIAGLSMLVSQAAKAQEIYFECEFSKKAIEDTIEACVPYLKRIEPDFNIILIGAPGCGKSTLGKELEKLIGGSFADLDTEIERKEQRFINEIFATDGEDYFRKKETEVLKESLSDKGKIISTGGGIIERNTISEMKNEKDIVVYIDTPVSILESRLKNDISRPLLAENAVEKLHSLLNRREKIYNNQCDIKIDTSGDIKENTVSILDGIIKKVNNR